jgi:hypothetical protein
MTSLFQKFTQGNSSSKNKEASSETNSILINSNDAAAVKRSSLKKKSINFSSESPTFIGDDSGGGGKFNSASQKDRESAVAADLAELFLSEDSSESMEPSLLEANISNNVTNVIQANGIESSSLNNFGMTMSEDFLANSNATNSKVSHSSSLNSNTSGYVTNSNSNSSESQNPQNGSNSISSISRRSKLESVNSVTDDLVTLNNNETNSTEFNQEQQVTKEDRYGNTELLDSMMSPLGNYNETNSGGEAIINGNPKLPKYLTTPLNAATFSTTPMIGSENETNIKTVQGEDGKSGGKEEINRVYADEKNEATSVASRAAMFNNLSELNSNSNNNNSKLQTQTNQIMSSNIISGMILFSDNLMKLSNKIDR